MHRKFAVVAGAIVLSTCLLLQAQTAQPQITDPAEYNAYVPALGEADNAKKIQLLDAFLAKYPNTVVKEQALEVKLTAQLQLNQTAAVEQTAKDILKVNPNNTRCLLILSSLFLQTQLNPQDPQFQQKVADAEAAAKRGIDTVGSLVKPATMSDVDFAKQKSLTASTHYQTLALAAAHRKDNNAALEAYIKAAELSPNDGTLFYQIASTLDKIVRAPGLSDPEKIAKSEQRIWYFARAMGIEGLQPAGKTQIDPYLVNLYKIYHGSEDGLAQVREQAKASPFPPSGFHIKTKAEMAPPPPPPPVEPPIPDDVTKMPFGQIKNVLSKGDDKAKEVFGKLKGTGMGLDGKVVSATPATLPKTIRIAVLKKTQEAEGEYDVVLTLTAAARPAAVAKGKTVEFEGVVKDFKDSPFSLMIGDGKILPPSRKP